MTKNRAKCSIRKPNIYIYVFLHFEICQAVNFNHLKWKEKIQQLLCNYVLRRGCKLHPAVARCHVMTIKMQHMLPVTCSGYSRSGCCLCLTIFHPSMWLSAIVVQSCRSQICEYEILFFLFHCSYNKSFIWTGFFFNNTNWFNDTIQFLEIVLFFVVLRILYTEFSPLYFYFTRNFC